MGGKAIKIAERVNKETYDKYAEKVIPKLKKVFNTEVFLITSFHDKQDFGDMDVLVLVNKDFGDREKIIQKHFNPQEINKNSHILSFNYNELQVDLIFTPLDNWETSKIFFCNGDLGNFMGKLVNSYGKLNHHGYLLKYGYDGLKCKIVHGGKSKKVFLTKDSQEVFNLLGLSFKRWKQGFHNKEEMFDYVISSPMFDYRAFQWENISSINKHRNKRRPNYHIFLEYIEKHKHRVIDWAPYTDYLDILKDRFNVDLKEEMEKLKQLVKEDKEIKYKFNGQLIMEKFPHLKGKELGDTMTEFKNQFKDWRKYALSTSSEEIMEHFKNKINEKGRL
jgi:hypothetical protein